MMTIGIIGLGSMGQGMAKNILAAGFALKGYDVAPAARAAFAQAGGHAADSIAAVCADAEILLLMVVNARQVREVLFGEGNALSALPKGAVIIVSATVAPTDIRALAADLQPYDVLLVDAPVSGGKAGADAGTLTIMAAGAAAALAKAMPLLEAMAKKVYCLGDTPGIGSTYKMVHQLAAGVHLVAAAELMALGAKAGCDSQTLFDIVSTSAGQSWMFNDRVPRMLAGDYTPRSMVDIFIKDLGLILQEGKALSMPLPLCAAAQQMLLAAAGMGHGRLDDAAVVKVYEAMSGDCVKRPPD